MRFFRREEKKYTDSDYMLVRRLCEEVLTEEKPCKSACYTIGRFILDDGKILYALHCILSDDVSDDIQVFLITKSVFDSLNEKKTAAPAEIREIMNGKEPILKYNCTNTIPIFCSADSFTYDEAKQFLEAE